MYTGKLNIQNLLLWVLAAASVTYAGERTDFLVNDDGGSAAQNNPRIAVAADRSFVITWVDRRGGTSDIYLQRYGPDGDSIGGNIKVNDDANNSYQFEPAIGVDLSGLYSVVWKDYRNGSYPFGPDVYFQRFDSSVSEVGSNSNLTTEHPDSTKESPDIALADWGGGVVVWADYRNRNWDIYGQVISSDGSLIGSNFRANDDLGFNQQHAPRVAVAPQGWFVVTWYDNRLGDDDIFVQRFDSLGNELGNNVRVNDDTASVRQAFPDVACDGAGHFTVVWVDWRNGNYPSNPDIYSKKFDTTMTPVTTEIKVNTDGTDQAQREPTIASDRMGNVAIIWADSTVWSWDIAGQMIDADGVVREANFTANSFTDSLQLHPDVALDGKYRYIAWADNRNGDFDVFASIQKYNDPSLEISPPSLKFEMLLGGALPGPQSVAVDHFGYNPLDFTVGKSVGWLNVAPSSGTTPATIVVSVNTDTLPAGTHLASLTFTDTFFHDSSVVMSVRLDVYAPVMRLSVDTLFYTVFEEVDEDYVDEVVVENIGHGPFAWVASESADWLNLSSYSGVEWDTLQVIVNARNLSDGIYIEPVVFESADASGSPDTLFVLVDVIDNMPYIGLQPDNIYARVYDLTDLDTFVVVNNLGVGILNWQATVVGTWLGLNRYSGLSGDTIGLSIADFTLDYGVYTSSVDVTDSAAFNVSARFAFVLEYFERSGDTIRLDPAAVEISQSTSLSIGASLVDETGGVFLPLQYDTTALTVDSVLRGQNLPDQVAFSSQIDAAYGLVSVRIDADPPDTFVAPGEYHLAELFFTARDCDTTTKIDTVYNDTLAVSISYRDGRELTPVFVPGIVTITSSTDIRAEPCLILPNRFLLTQNSPNPFNITTLITYELPRKSKVTLEVFNILGQKVATLVSETQVAGRYAVTWNGRLKTGRVAPSGIYFYRLRAGNVSLVRKMMLLK